MERFNLQDLPDNWYDIIAMEGDKFINRISIYPPELRIILIQAIMQNIIYNHIKKENREEFVKLLCDTFIDQFEDWEEEDQANGEQGLE